MSSPPTTGPLTMEQLVAELRSRAFEEIPPDATGSLNLLEDVGLDSIDFVEVAVVIQELAGVPIDEFASLPVTLADLYDEYLRLRASAAYA